jgi:TnpA family transposase
VTQQERFETAQAKVKAFMVKHGNVVLMGETTKALKVKERFYALQDAAANAYWTDEMDTWAKVTVR